jgi:hypothetical protein
MAVKEMRPSMRSGDDFNPGEYQPDGYVGVLVTCVSLKPDDSGILREYGDTVMVGSMDLVAGAIQEMNNRLLLLQGTVYYQAGVQIVYPAQR